jgi:hypothetical protein
MITIKERIQILKNQDAFTKEDIQFLISKLEVVLNAIDTEKTIPTNMYTRGQVDFMKDLQFYLESK